VSWVTLVQYFKYNILRSLPIKDTIDALIPSPIYDEDGNEEQLRTQVWVRLNVLHNYTVTTHEEVMTKHPNTWLQIKAKPSHSQTLRFFKDSDLSSSIDSLIDLLDGGEDAHIAVSLEQGKLVARIGEEQKSELIRPDLQAT